MADAGDATPGPLVSERTRAAAAECVQQDTAGARSCAGAVLPTHPGAGAVRWPTHPGTGALGFDALEFDALSYGRLPAAA